MIKNQEKTDQQLDEVLKFLDDSRKIKIKSVIDVMHFNLIQRLFTRLAHIVGLQTVTREQLNIWSWEADQLTKIAGDYEFSDERLCGINDGRSEILNRVVHTIVVCNQDSNK